MAKFNTLALVVGIIASVQLARGGEFIWVEGETPTTANFQFKAASSPICSDDKWLHYTTDKAKGTTIEPANPPASQPGGKPPKEEPKAVKLDEPLVAQYDFQAKQAGEYEFWARIGFEFARAPLQFQVDGGEWKTVAPEDLTTNVMRIGRWCEDAWMKIGMVKLDAGKHILKAQCVESTKGGRVLIGLDCFAFIAGGNWTPEGRLKPGEQYNEQIDKDAAGQVFKFAAEIPAEPSARAELPLEGLWQVARYDDMEMSKDIYEPIKALPKENEYELRWRGIKLPVAGDAEFRQDLMLGHRLIYQTKIDVPEKLKGRSFVLHFSGTAWIVGVFVNGQYIGGHKSSLVPWDIDITKGVKPGQANVVSLVIKDWYYAIDNQSHLHKAVKTVDRKRNQSQEDVRNNSFVAPVYPSSKGEDNVPDYGITKPIKLVVAGPAYTSDTFVRTSAANKKLDATVTVANPGGAAADIEVQCEAVHVKTGKSEKTFNPVKVSVPAGGSQAVEVGGDWADAKLWWPSESVDDLPDCYWLKTTLTQGGKALDVRQDLFGFREITIRGKDLLLNGVVWRLWNWVDVPRTSKTEQQWFEKYHGQYDRFHRICADTDNRLWGYREKALDFFDRYGVPGRLSTCIDGMFINYNLRNDLVWENFAEHVRQLVLAYRNHPSILMYSLENELIFINAVLRFRNEYNICEDKFHGLCKLAKELDPTRPSFGDGAGDCRSQCEINCQHYAWPRGEEFPTQSYKFKLKPENEDHDTYRKNNPDRKDLFVWDGKRPLIGGEEFYYSGNVSGMAWIGGPDVYRGKKFADKAAGLYMLIAGQGARWQGETGFCPWVAHLPEADNAMKPRTVFVREWNSVFFPGGQLKRTIKVFNSTRRNDPLTLKWKLVFDGKDADSGQKTYPLQAGQEQEDSLTAKLPASDKRMEGQLNLELSAGGKVVFSDSRPITVLPKSGTPAGLDAQSLALYDPEGTVRKWMEDRKLPFNALESLADIPAGVKVVVVGKDAITADIKKTFPAKLRELIPAGKIVIILEQKTPMEGGDLPLADIMIAGEEKDKPARPEYVLGGGKSGQIAFPMAMVHPVFRDLAQRDFFTWSGDEVVFRSSYSAPPGGVIPLIQAGGDLGLMPMMEAQIGTGSLVLSQALIASKLTTEPVADRLLYNLLNWTASKASAKPGKTLAALAGDKTLESFISETSVKMEPCDSVAAALAGDANVLIVKATPAAVAELNQSKDKVKAFCEKGGWIMLCNVDEKGINDFNQLVGFEHRLRKFRKEAVVLGERTDPLLMGLSDRDVNMLGMEFIASWKNLYYVSDRVFTNVVDGDQIAGFAVFGAAATQGTEGKTAPSTVLTDGLTNADFWKYIQYFKSGGDEFDLIFDKPETFTRFSFCSAPIYHTLKDIELLFDGKDAAPFTSAQTTDMQEVEFTPRQAKVVTVRIKDFYPGDSRSELVQIDDLQLFRKMPDGWDKRVILLTQPGGLVKYPIGKGGILLNQIDYTETFDPKSRDKGVENIKVSVKKKLSLYSNLLRNLGSSFNTASPPPPEKPKPAPKK
ncbi:MAG: hypothetical protein HZA50_08375 [Planctomycetes bacterium]|nr:hypothetical protein [Planctomycetota bacterium]